MTQMNSMANNQPVLRNPVCHMQNRKESHHVAEGRELAETILRSYANVHGVQYIEWPSAIVSNRLGLL